MNKEQIIIIALIVVIIYLAYQQNNQTNLVFDKVGYDNLVKDLKRQVQHYQTLYENRVKKDLGVQEGKEVEIQTDFSGENKETQTPLKVNYSQNTQTDLSDKQISLLTQQ